MTSKIDDAEPLAELTRLLEAWGGEAGRWPPPVRQRIERLTAGGGEVSALLAQARALDRVLDRGREAPAGLSAARQRALADRIVAAALAQEGGQSGAVGPTGETPRQAVRRTAEVIALPQRKRLQVAAANGSRWQAAGLMAASLLAGLYLGGSLNLAPVLQELADAVGISSVIDPTQIALGDDISDEDTL